MRSTYRVATCAGMLLALAMLPHALRAADSKAGLELFEKKIRPVLVEHCYQCHAADSKEIRGGLRVDTRQAIRAGGDSGPAVSPGDLDASLILDALRHDSFEMPPDQKLSAEVISDFEQWIELGAPDPREGEEVVKAKSGIDWEQGRKWWAFQPVTAPPIPDVKDSKWPQTSVDRFLLAEMESVGLAPAAPAERSTLLRRLHFALLGLPPSPADLAAFLADDSPQAVEREVDRLLASPHFGERWGRHWLDVARFAESSGGGRTLLFRDAWRYRDYVIASFNADKPFDQMIREQIAGDLLPSDSRSQRADQLTGTGFLALGPTNYELQDKELLRMEIIDEQIDTIGKAFLGMTIGCARCHDHKFDPIASEDYYGLAGIFRSTKSLLPGNVGSFVTTELPAPPELAAQKAAHEKKVAAQEAVIAKAKQQATEIKQALAKLSEVPVDLANLDGLVIDNEQAELVGMWVESSSTSGYVGSIYLHDNNSDRGTKSATFTAALPAAGKYEVRVSYTASSNRTSKAHVTVIHAKGETVKFVNQQQLTPLTGNFASLGEFEFAKGAGTVVISNQDANGHVIADAVQFIPLNLAATDAPSPEEMAKREREQQKVKALTAMLTAAEKELSSQSNELKSLKKQAPPVDKVMSVRDEEKPADYHICIRGNAHNLGEVTPRSTMRVIADQPVLDIPEGQSGRLQLAQWIADDSNPLTARVFVNRVWQHLFGRGLVTTPDNFGASGDQPSNARLLDHLASEFMADGWSTKRLVRRLVLSRAYAMRSTPSAQAREKDPDNVYLSHFRRQRLDAESIRDALLATSNTLDLTAGGPTIRGGINSEFGYRFTGERRSVYVPRFRNTLPTVFAVFDIANPNLVTGHRATSTLPTQALFFMNSDVVLEQAQQVAKSIIAEEGLDQQQRVDLAFRQLLSREPTSEELALSATFLNSADQTDAKAVEHKWVQFCHSLYCSLDFRYVK